MASKYKAIELTVINAVKEISGTTPIAFPNKELPVESKEGMWLQVSNVRGESQPVTLGSDGEDNHPAFIQIDINYPKGKGSGLVLDKADEFLSYFTAGKTLTYNSQWIKVTSTSLSGDRYVGGFYRVSVTIYYYARTKRN